MKKRAWKFVTLMDQYGTLIMDRDIDAEEALRECRLSLGAKVVRVF